MEYVCVIAEEQSFTAAALRLQIAQPTLTRQVRRVEDRLGARLFDRSRTGVTLTPAGEVYAARARPLLAEAAAMEDEVRITAQGLAGRLRLGFAGSAINGPLGPAIARLRQALPQVELELHEAFDDSVLMAGIRDRSLDLAVHRLPIRDPSLSSVPWAREPLALFLSQGDPRASATGEIALEELADVPLIMWPRDSAPQAYDEIMAIFQRAGAVPHTVATAQTVQTMLALIANGVGAAIMADSYRQLRRTGVRSRPIAGTYATHHVTTHISPASAVVGSALDVLGLGARSSHPGGGFLPMRDNKGG